MNAGKTRTPLTRRSRSAKRRIDATARIVIEQFVRVLRRCHYSPDDIASAVASAVRAEAGELPAPKRSETRELRDAPHVMSVWHTDPLYTDQRGRPIPLKVHGPAPSFQSLVGRVSRSRRVEVMLNYLVRAGAIERRQGRVCVRMRWVSLRGMLHETSARSLRGLRGMLSNYEHNLLPRDQVESWFEYTAENDHFPKSHEGALADFYMRDCMASLRRVDAFMLRCEQERKPGEPTMRVGFGMYRYQDEEDATARSRSTRRTVATRGGRRTGRRTQGGSRERRNRTPK